jgi:hypothetical protein
VADLGVRQPCFAPTKDILIPTFAEPDGEEASPFIGAAAQTRGRLAFFSGRYKGLPFPRYSRGIRHRLADLKEKGGWWDRYRISINEERDHGGSWSARFASSVFCLVSEKRSGGFCCVLFTLVHTLSTHVR